jgi:nicotinamidase-related amidase
VTEKPRTASTALIVVDMLNPYDHDDADALIASVQPIVARLRDLLELARERHVAVVYVNDQHDDFTATRDDIVDRALAGRRPDLVEPLVPSPGCAFLQKVRHSIFYGTSLDYMLRRREIDRLVLTGQVTEQCVLYSALDAYIRHYDVSVVRDAVAHIDAELGAAALEMMRRNMRAEIVDAAVSFRDNL